ncbi:hypothetical protein IMG5_199550 [Ichthyophthirius multifiliis]|uniref:ABC transporter domain-containing protein n=1 Tax=Ichthyophthirius multifiliis TaxID=5932 RepID=G0R5L5_ICHMU|nr:hypothetical protein IMG5_199550 [Ichthyophthirius multifiliis]EGR27275.1 hypothetical protein IMG5_199550 [Ichthyophthirius multifiliis]|eukprot:XP_004024159.1 hypothetical protein IMG5_199550 [Ichthyophthirius multifiliis]
MEVLRFLIFSFILFQVLLCLCNLYFKSYSFYQRNRIEFVMVFKINSIFLFWIWSTQYWKSGFICYKEKKKQKDSPFDMNIAGGDIIYLVVFGFLNMGLIIVFEYLSHSSKFTQLISGETNIPYQPKEYDDDVQKEMDMIQNSKPEDFTVRVSNLRKVFVPAKNRVKVAVDKVSFGIKQGEVFTLLGVNGAGKTTTFKILSGEIQPTSGECHIAGYSVQTQLEQARMNIGYCPQFDALLENLTAREHLNLYASIKGIPKSIRAELVQKKLEEMDLLKFEGYCAGTFSGGNKRKLSVAIAMIGNPSIIFLDEPSTGMDPAARQFMWKVIKRISTVNKHSSIILTTHSMEEAEQLSSKMAIQVDGQLKCLGTIQQVKHKFGKGYEVEVKIKKPSVEHLSSLCQKAELQLNDKILLKDLPNILSKLNAMELQSLISDNQSGSIIYKELKSQKGITMENLTEFIYVENQGFQIMMFLEKEFGKFDEIEHIGDFYRYRIETSVTIGKIFGSFEKNKEQLKISEYSLKQATIEQIFNQFAEGKIMVNEHIKKSKTNIQAYEQKKRQSQMEINNQN